MRITLESLYPRLRPAERVKLVLEAEVRGDHAAIRQILRPVQDIPLVGLDPRVAEGLEFTVRIVLVFAAMTGQDFGWLGAAVKGARWIRRKRLPKDSGRPEAGLLPAGFSAEHLGPNDFYYWDDFWAVGGLQAVARLPGIAARDAAEAAREATEFLALRRRLA